MVYTFRRTQTLRLLENMAVAGPVLHFPRFLMPASKRAVVTVATGPYVALQARLLASLNASGWTGPLLAWTDALPPDSPPHDEAPYGFKIYAIAEALRQGHTSILWMDSPCEVIRPLDPLFEHIERTGHLFTTSGERLGNWTSDECLEAFGLDRDAALGLTLFNGTLIGLDYEQQTAREWFRRWRQQCEAGLFRGPYLSELAPEAVKASKPGKAVGPLSPDPRCWGHRHDEAVGSALAHLMGMDIAPAPELFSVDDDVRAAVRFRRA